MCMRSAATPRRRAARASARRRPGPGGSSSARTGGASLFGGRGKTIHGVLGGLMIGGIYNGLILIGVTSDWIDIVVAMVLLAAGVIDVLSRRGAQPRA